MMKVSISLLCLVSLALCEPPVGDGYPASRSSHDLHHGDDHEHPELGNQRPLSQEYGVPSFASSRSALSTTYLPNSRTAPNSRSLSQKFSPPSVRVSFNQRFRSSTIRNSAQGHAASASRSHTAVNARSEISQEYGSPAPRSLSQEYGVPPVAFAATLTPKYGVPDARQTSAQEHSVPVLAPRNNQMSHSTTSNFLGVQPTKVLSQDYSAPVTRSRFQTGSQSQSNTVSLTSNTPWGHDASKTNLASRNAPSSTYGDPSSRSLSTSLGVSSPRNSKPQEFVSQTFGSNSQRDLSETYGTPSARGISQEYGVPSRQTNLMNDAVPSTYVSARSSPSSSYLPADRNAMPSEQYEVPEHRDAASQGYDYARAKALEELQNQEPANYDFGYQIEDQESGNDFGHTETREDNKAKGSYFVVLPDGTKQTVEYEADERGFKPRISVEPADGSGGYDENAADMARAAKGPY